MNPAHDSTQKEPPAPATSSPRQRKRDHQGMMRRSRSLVSCRLKPWCVSIKSAKVAGTHRRHVSLLFPWSTLNWGESAPSRLLLGSAIKIHAAIALRLAAGSAARGFTRRRSTVRVRARPPLKSIECQESEFGWAVGWCGTDDCWFAWRPRLNDPGHFLRAARPYSPSQPGSRPSFFASPCLGAPSP
jgi:hypothetical protein